MRALLMTSGLLVLGLSAGPAGAGTEPAFAKASAGQAQAEAKPPAEHAQAKAPAAAPAGHGQAEAKAPATQAPAAAAARHGTAKKGSEGVAPAAGSIALAQAAVLRVLANAATAPAGSAVHAAGPSRSAPSTRQAVAARATATGETRAALGIGLHWPDVPAATRQLTWDPDIDPREVRDGVRLVWKPVVP